jgi:hypothetical protein
MTSGKAVPTRFLQMLGAVQGILRMRRRRGAEADGEEEGEDEEEEEGEEERRALLLHIAQPFACPLSMRFS